MTAVSDCIGQRVLLSIEGSEPLMACPRALSPRGQYVWLCASSTDESGQWRHVSFVNVLEVLGSAAETVDQLSLRLAPAAAVKAGQVSITATT